MHGSTCRDMATTLDDSLVAWLVLTSCCLVQDNLLWDQLTARQHLAFYGRLKGLKVRGGACAWCSGLWETCCCMDPMWGLRV